MLGFCTDDCDARARWSRDRRFWSVPPTVTVGHTLENWLGSGQRRNAGTRVAGRGGLLLQDGEHQVEYGGGVLAGDRAPRDQAAGEDRADEDVDGEIVVQAVAKLAPLSGPGEDAPQHRPAGRAELL